MNFTYDIFFILKINSRAGDKSSEAVYRLGGDFGSINVFDVRFSLERLGNYTVRDYQFSTYNSVTDYSR